MWSSLLLFFSLSNNNKTGKDLVNDILIENQLTPVLKCYKFWYSNIKYRQEKYIDWPGYRRKNLSTKAVLK
jgi:hypothetical protein